MKCYTIRKIKFGLRENCTIKNMMLNKKKKPVHWSRKQSVALIYNIKVKYYSVAHW